MGVADPIRGEPRLAAVKEPGAETAGAGPGLNAWNARAVRGMSFLAGRQVICQAVAVTSSITLARLLEPYHFGIFGVAAALAAAFSLFSEFGLAPSLVQRKAEPDERELQVAFTLQLLLVAVAVLVGLVASPFVVEALYPGRHDVVWLARILLASLFLTSARAISIIRLERQLRHDRLALIETVETLAYYGLVVCLAWFKWGVWSLVWATALRTLLGAILTFRTAPWSVRLAWDRKVALELLRYGIPFQVGVLANSVSGWIAPLLVGTLVGPAGVGYLTWATSNGKKPLMLVESVMRVAFPHFSRLQEHPEELARTAARYLCYLGLGAGLWGVLIHTAGARMVALLYTAKWLPAVPALSLAATVLMLDLLHWVLGISLASTGRVSVTSRLVLARTAITLALLWPMVHCMGFSGVIAAHLAGSALVTPSALAALGPGPRRILIRGAAWLLAPVLLTTGCGWILARFFSTELLGTIALCGSTAALYSLSALAAAPPWLRESLLTRLHSARLLTASR